MGQELDCTMHYNDRSLLGRAQLETDFLLFRGEERLKIQLKELTDVTAVDGVLKLEFPGGPAALDLGKAAGKWAQKILHPPSTLDKLGIKEGSSVGLIGDFHPTFRADLQQRGAAIASTLDQHDLLCFAATKTADLNRVAGLAGSLAAKGALWIVYPKGGATIRELEVIQAGRAAKLKDVKVASFSPTHTALKFVK